MKKLSAILTILIFSFVAFFLVSCSSDDNKYKIFTEQNLTLNGEQIDLPDIKLNNKTKNWDEFYYENEDEYIYVYNGKICLTETAPDEFETELKISYKNNYDVNTTVLVNKPYIPITSVNIEITNQRIYPGEYVYYNVNYQPQNAILKNYTVEFDKPEYIESQGNGKFKLKDTTPLNEKVKIIITTNNNLSCEQETTVDNTVYEVYNVAQLRRMANDPYGYFKIMKDIDFSDTQWLPISDFYGVLNGDGYTISNFEITLRRDSSNNDKYGLFETLNGVVENLTIKNTRLTIDKYDDENQSLSVGIVCAVMDNGNITNVVVDDAVIWAYHYRAAKKDHINVDAGGFVGLMNNGTIENCKSSNLSIHTKSGTVSGTADAHSFAGGIVGNQFYGIVKNCEIGENVSIECLVRGNSSTSALRTCAGGLVGFQSFYGIIETKLSIYSPYLKAIYDIEDDWVYANSSFSSTGVVCGQQNGKLIYE